MRAFISHISEESVLAACLKDWIETTLLGTCDVFVSSDSTALPAGSKWLEVIDKALRDANVVLVLCSAASLPRPWVNFETGCAWARRVPVIPLCHTGIDKASLPRPMSEFQGINLNDPHFPRLLFEALQVHLKLAKLPRIDHAAMQSDISAALAGTRPVDSPGTTGVPVAGGDIQLESVRILRYLAQQSVSRSSKQIAEHFQSLEPKTQFFLDELLRHKLVRDELNMLAGTRYALSESGRQYLFERGFL